MLAALRTAFRLDPEASQRQGGFTGSVDADELFDIARQSLPDWRGAARSCGNAVLPLCKAVHRVLAEDVEAIAQLHAQWEDEDSIIENDEPEAGPSSLPSRADIPTIVITPCEDAPRETSNWVPYQDAQFGMRLVVPAHAAVNTAFPPLIAPIAATPHWGAHWPERQWSWDRGHWRLVLPTPEEQARRGMASRAHLRKGSRAGMRKRGRH